ncbi:hypothetical protein [Paraburkholderia sp. JPY419]|uniref:hypothetical protein n=1 Tax=Paraburkholderia sp. JPY419 TaxID=667660 RepID=UPI003D1963A6
MQTALNADAMRAQRDYYRRVDELERAVLAAVRSGDCFGLAPDVSAITAAVLGMPCANRGLNVDSILIDRDNTRAQWVALLVLSDGNHRTLAVPYPCAN